MARIYALQLWLHPETINEESAPRSKRGRRSRLAAGTANTRHPGSAITTSENRSRAPTFSGDEPSGVDAEGHLSGRGRCHGGPNPARQTRGTYFHAQREGQDEESLGPFAISA